MNSRARRIIAIIALLFMAVFTVTMIMSIINPRLFGGQIGSVALISGGLGLPLWFMLYLDSKRKEEDKENTEEPESDGENEDA